MARLSERIGDRHLLPLCRVLRELNEAVMVLDEGGVILYANDAFCELVGVPQAELEERVYEEQLPEEGRRRLREQLPGRRLGDRPGKLAKPRERFELALPCPDGSEVPVIMSLREIPDFLDDGRGILILSATDISAQKEIERQLRQSMAEHEKHHREIERELRLAEKVQRSLIPASLQLPGLRVEVRYEPMLGLGGDCAWVRHVPPDEVYLSICDISGHGIAASLLVNRIAGEVQRLAASGVGPAELLGALNEFALDLVSGTGMFLTFAAGLLDLRARRLLYAGAGHVPTLVVHPDRGISRLPAKLPVLGVFSAAEGQPNPELLARFAPGDLIVMYTDGITEARDAAGKMLSLEGLEATIRRLPTGADAKTFADALLAEVYRYHHGPLQDDISLLVAEIL